MLGPVDGVHADDGVLDASLVVVLVLLGSHAEVEGLEGGLREDGVVPLLVLLQGLTKLLGGRVQDFLRCFLNLYKIL